MRSTAASSAAPPTTTWMGSRLPWTGLSGCTCAAAHWSGTLVSRPTASQPDSRANSGYMGPAPRGKPMIGTAGWTALTRWTMRRMGSMTQRRNSSSGSTPAQLSKICRASAPASTWAMR